MKRYGCKPDWIFDPKTKTCVSIESRRGKELLKEHLKQFKGEKAVFNYLYSKNKYEHIPDIVCEPKREICTRVLKKVIKFMTREEWESIPNNNKFIVDKIKYILSSEGYAIPVNILRKRRKK